MPTEKDVHAMQRRRFLRLTAAALAAPAALGAEPHARAAAPGGQDRIRNQRPAMTYRKLGRTDIVSSRLVFGCGAALAGGKAVRLLDRAFEAGINCYDVGSNTAYKGSEQSLAPFMKKHRDEIWVVSKAPLRLKARPDEIVSVEIAKTAAETWSRLLEGSLKDLDADYVDGYCLMGVDNPSLVRSEEMHKAFLQAKKAGKVGYFGLSTHKNAQAVLEAAAEAGWYDLAMIAITPAGWYDWDTKQLEEQTPALLELQAVLRRARGAGIGLIGMKAARLLAAKAALGSNDPTAFDCFYDAEAKAWPLNPFQRSYAYLLAHGLDVVNADMQNFAHLEENLAVVKPA